MSSGHLSVYLKKFFSLRTVPSFDQSITWSVYRLKILLLKKNDLLLIGCF